jgi:hypothetical protein
MEGAKRMRNTNGILRLGLAALALAACGKGAKGDCPQLDICGGSPASATAWLVTDVCQVDPVRPAQPGDTIDFTGTPPLAPTVAPPQPSIVASTQTTSGDWCSDLVFTFDTQGYHVTNANLWHNAPHFADPKTSPSTILFGSDHSYLTKLVMEDQNATHFDPRCLVANGAPVPQDCDKSLGAALTSFYMAAAVGAAPPDFSGIKCSTPPGTSPADYGCDCTYTYNLEIDDSGTWANDPADTTILLQDSTSLQFNGATMNAEASTTMLRSSMCAQPNSLQLSGWRGGSLMNVQGLRTLGLQPM